MKVGITPERIQKCTIFGNENVIRTLGTTSAPTITPEPSLLPRHLPLPGVPYTWSKLGAIPGSGNVRKTARFSRILINAY